MENIQTSIFKAYDFRGIYPTEIDADVMERMGRAFAIFANSPKILVGYDMRVSAPETSVAFIKGVTSAGVNVVDLGQISTDTIYFASGHYELPGAVITASHNPKEYTGVKFCKSGAEPIGAETGLEDIKEMVLKNEWKEVENMGEVEKNENILAEFSEHCHKFIDREKIKPLNIVIDAGNGMGGKIVPAVFDSLPFEITPLYFELDGNFPNHEANPKVLENLVDIQERMRAGDFDLGIATDGDGDRVFLLDEKGDLVDPWYVHGIVAQEILPVYPMLIDQTIGFLDLIVWCLHLRLLLE